MNKTLENKLHAKRIKTERKIKQLEKMGKAKERYTATISDIHFLITGLLCDIGWLIQFICEVKYLMEYGINSFIDFISLIAFMAVCFGVSFTIYLNIIHEKEIATSLQKNLSFGMTIFGGLLCAVIAIFNMHNYLYIGMFIGGIVNFIFGLPIFMSFKKGIIYSE